MKKKLFINPEPITSTNLVGIELSASDMNSASYVGGGIPATVILACNKTFGAATIITVGNIFT